MNDWRNGMSTRDRYIPAFEAIRPDIDGLCYFPGFLDGSAQRDAMEHIDASPWRRDLKRRVQHYGWRYDYQARVVSSDMRLGPLPGWIAKIAERLYREAALFDRVPDQAIVNEYEPGQGIALHADRDCFGPVVATVSLGDDWEMRLRPIGGTRHDDRRTMLVRGSALVMAGEARFRWMHGIDERKTERDRDGKRDRRRRLSLTFRTVETVLGHRPNDADNGPRNGRRGPGAESREPRAVA